MLSYFPLWARYVFFVFVWMGFELLLKAVFLGARTPDGSAAFSGGLICGIPLTTLHYFVFMKKAPPPSRRASARGAHIAPAARQTPPVEPPPLPAHRESQSTPPDPSDAS